MPLGIACHFSRQPRQQVAVACWATKTGCFPIGVCLPSLGGNAGPRLLLDEVRSMGKDDLQPLLVQILPFHFPSRKSRRKPTV